MIKKIFIFILTILSISLLISCSSSKSFANTPPSYFYEKELNLPSLSNIYDLKKINTSNLSIIGTNSDNIIKKYTSSDGGDNWKEDAIPLFNSDDSICIRASISDNGDIALIYFNKKYQNNRSIDNNIKFEACIISNDKSTLNKLTIDNEDFFNLAKFKLDSNNDLFYSTFDGKIVQYDSLSGLLKNTFLIDTEELIDFCVVSDTLIILSTKHLIQYNLNTGKEVKRIKNANFDIDNFSSIYSSYEDDSIYIINSQGLFEYNILDENLVKTFDSQAYTMSDNKLYINNFINISENKFLIIYGMYNSNEKILCNYSSNNSLVISDLKVYSLYENDLIRNLINEFNRKNPNINLKYEIGIQDESTLTQSDAIKTLNTELANGTGPDILLLDDLPINEYVEQGIFDNLSELLEDKSDFIENILNLFYTENQLYTIPLRVKVPLIVGDNSIVENTNSMDSLIEIFSKTTSSNKIMNIYDCKDLINLTYYIFCNNFVNRKNLNTNSIKNYLIELKQLYKLISSKMDIESSNMYTETINQVKPSDINEFSKKLYLEKNLDSISFLLNNQPQVDIGYINSFNDLALFSTVRNHYNNINFSNFKDNSRNIFIPKTMISINSKSPNKDLAKQFIMYLLNNNSQCVDKENGLPINKKALDSIFSENIDNTNLGGYTIGTAGNLKDYPIIWPSETEYEQLMKIMNSLNSVAIKDEYLLDSLLVAGEKYILDQFTIDDALNYISEELFIHLNE